VSAETPNYYEVLGILPTATPEEIKRRYRELARRCHPDVARTPDAADRFREINEANATLSDTAKRANYDARLKLEELKRDSAARRDSAAGTTAGRAGEGETRSGGDKDTWRQGNTTPRTGQRQPPQSQPRQPARPAQDLVQSILHEAQRAMSRLKFREAEILARRANKMRRTSLGYEILGDVFRSRGSTDEAVAMYSYALQLDRSNRDVQLKFDKLVGQRSGPTMAGTAARSSRPGARVAAAATRPSSIVATLIGVLALGVLLFASSRIGSPATGPWLLDFDPLYVFALAASGGITGFLLAANGALPRAGQELLAATARPGRSPTLPFGPLVIAFGLLNYFAALLVFLVVGILTDRLSKPILLAFASALAVTLVFAIVNSAAAGWTLLSGSGVALLGLLAGWSAGSSLGAQPHR